MVKIYIKHDKKGYKLNICNLVDENSLTGANIQAI